jgi:nucleoid-associated protein YgaU
MTFSPDSRYTTATVTVVDDPLRGQHQSVDPASPTDRTIQFTFYQVDADDTADSLAYDLLGKGQYWWMIADANPEILDWNNLVPGTVLRIPSV